jgi:hypothetical protein
MIGSFFLDSGAYICFDPPDKFDGEKRGWRGENGPSISCNPDGYLL